MDLVRERQQWEDHARSEPLADDVVVQELVCGGVHCVSVCAGCTTEDKVIVYVHGGGLVSGSAVTHTALAAAISGTTGFSVMVVEYRLLPESPFPAPLDDVLAVCKALINDSGCSADNIILGGDSSGAALILSAMIRLRDDGLELPSAGFMLCAALDASLSGESMAINDGRDPLLSRKELIEWRDTYVHRPDALDMSPLFADLQDLPEFLLLAGGRDLWLSDSVTVESRMRNAGVRVNLRVWESMGHVWMMDPSLPESTEAMSEIGQFVRTGLAT